MIEFKKTEAESTQREYQNEPVVTLQPGKYLVLVKSAKYVNTGKTPFLLVVFERETKELHFERFYLTDNSIGRLQYLHEVCFKKSLEANFANFEEVANYFVDSLKYDPIKIGITIGGELVDGRLFTKLPYKYFAFNIVGFQEEVFSEGTPKYDALVKIVNRTNEASLTEEKSVILSSKSNDIEEKIAITPVDDLPF